MRSVRSLPGVLCASFLALTMSVACSDGTTNPGSGTSAGGDGGDPALRNVRLSDGAVSHLTAALRRLTGLQKLRFRLHEAHANLDGSLLTALMELPQLQALELSGPAIVNSVGELAEAMAAHGRLRELNLSTTAIGDDGAAHLAAMLEQNRSLSVLNLQFCRVGDAGLERLGRALTRNTTLRKLDVQLNTFGADGVARFADLMGDMHGLQMLIMNVRWAQQLLPGIERNYSLLELVFFAPVFQAPLQRNWRGYDKAKAAVLLWLCICHFHPPKGITRDIALIIARHIYASRGQRCWIDNDNQTT